MPSHAQDSYVQQPPAGAPAPPGPAAGHPDPLEPDPLERERAHLSSSRAALRAMREDVEALDITDVTATGSTRDPAAEIDGSGSRRSPTSPTPRCSSAASTTCTPPARLAEGAAAKLLHRPPPRARRRRRPDGRRLAGAGLAAVLPGLDGPSRWTYALRRRFGYTGGDLTAYEDEHLSDPTRPTRPSKLLQAEIERPRVGPMRDIVATIQPEQDEIVRAGVDRHGVRAGRARHREDGRRPAPGGLPAVRAPRAAGPHRHAGHRAEPVLPALHRAGAARAGRGAGQAGHRGRPGRRTSQVRGTDSAEAARLKGDARMAEVLRRAVRSGVDDAHRAGAWWCAARGAGGCRPTSWRRSSASWLDRDIRYGAARDALPQRIAHAVLVRMERAGEAPDDRVQDAVARNAAVKAAVKACWPAGRPGQAGAAAAVATPTSSARAADGVLDRARAEDAAVGEAGARAAARRSGRPPTRCSSTRRPTWCSAPRSLGHVVLDEAQDLSPMQYRAVGRRCSTGSATVLGDLAQGTTPWATALLGGGAGAPGQAGRRTVEELTRGFRVPREVIAYASRLLPAIAPGLAPATSSASRPARFGRAVARDDAGAGRGVVARVPRGARREGSVGLIAADRAHPRADRGAGRGRAVRTSPPATETSADARLTLVPASLGQGPGVRLRRPGRPGHDRRRASRTSAPGCAACTCASPGPSRG